MIRLLHLFVLGASVVGSLTLAQLAQAQLTHRWSFDGNAEDSVGNSDWTVNGATFAGGEVNFDGVDDSLNLATTPLPTAAGSSATIEVWGTYSPSSPTSSRIYDFATANGDFYLYLTPNSMQGDTRVGWDDDFNIEFGPTAPGTSNTGEEVLLTLVFDAAALAGNGEFRLYRDAALVSTLDATGLDILGSLAGTTANMLGYGQSNTTNSNPAGQENPPAYLDGSINEMRIYGNALPAGDILFNAVAGPDRANVTFDANSWSAGGSDDWNTAGNWSGGVPSTTDRATIGNGGEAIVSAAVPMVGALTINYGTLTITGDGSVGNVGDYNEDGTVNAADYTVYRDNVGADTLPNRDPANTGPIGPADYDSWTANFGNVLAGGSAIGSLDVEFPVELSPGDANSATININNGGRLSVSAIAPNASAGAKTINLDNGTIASNFASAVVAAGAVVVAGEGGGTIDTGGGQISWNSELSGSGSITKVGAGTLILTPLAPDNQNPNYTGQFIVDEGTVDIGTTTNAFGTGGSKGGGNVQLNNATLVVNTDASKEFPADLALSGENVLNDPVARTGREIQMRGNFTGDGSLEFIKPNLPDPLGIDFENRPNPDDADNPFLVDNSAFTGRVITSGSWAIRFRAEGGDFPNAIFDLNDPGAWAGKRGSDANQVIQLGGVEGLADPANNAWSRLTASIAGGGDPLAAVTFEIGMDGPDADFAGRIEDAGVDVTSVNKVGSNSQSVNGPSTYSGPTTIDGGTWLVNGQHSRDALDIATMGAIPTPADALPVSDYAVNTGGTLGGSGIIGSASDSVDVAVNGGSIAPGDGVGTLTVNGAVTFTGDATLAVELQGSLADQLVATSLSLAGASDSLDVSLLGSVDPGDYVIYMGGLSGEFENVTSGFGVTYGANSITLNVPAGLGAGSAIPEPGTLLLMWVAAALVGLRRRR